jgi:hypothetical protein
MTTENTDARGHRRIRGRTIAGLAIAIVAVASLTLVAVTFASRSASASATPSATPNSAPSASDIASAEPTADPSFSDAPASPADSPSPSPSPVRQPKVTEFYVAKATEPTVTADPSHPGMLAVASQNVVMNTPTSGCSKPAVRVSRDDGATWGTPTYPWGIGCQDIHATVAWGVNGRLWAGDAMGVPGGVAMSVSYSDDLGLHWTKPVAQKFTQPWSGCYASITVDTWSGSPNYGTIYVTYNWLASSHGPGVAVLASRDGINWSHTEVALETLPGYPFAWRIGYRVKAAPDGSAFVSFYQSDLQTWSQYNMMNEGRGANIGRMAFQISRIHFQGQTLSADAPYVAATVDDTEAEWQSGLAVDKWGEPWLAVESQGRISVGSPSGGWRQFEVTGYTSFKPSLAISGETIFVGWHVIDVQSQVWTYYTLSYDGGHTFLPPARITSTFWHAPKVVNGVGLRECADASDGVFYYAYGDNRVTPTGTSAAGVYVARIQP